MATNLSTGIDLIQTNSRSDLIHAYSSLFPNSQKIVNYQVPVLISGQSLSPYSIYDFEIDPLGLLAEIILEITLTTNTSQTNCRSRLATHLFDNIQICTSQGPSSIDRTLTPEYTNMRLDTLSADQSVIIYGTDPPELWTSGTVTVYLPLFFGFSERTDTYIFPGPKMVLRCRVGSETGLTNGISSITSFSVRAKQTYVTLPYNFKPMTELRLISDVWYEKSLSISSGATSVSMNPTCPFPSFTVFVTIRDSNWNYVRVDNLAMTLMGQTVFDVNRAGNYSLTTGSNETNNVGTIVYWFSYVKSRKNPSPIGLNALLNPELTLSWSTAVGSGFKLYVGFEYLNQMVINNGNFLRINNY